MIDEHKQKTSHHVKVQAAPAQPPERKEDGTSTMKFVILTVVLLGILAGLVFIPSYLREKKFEQDKYNNFEFVKREDGFWYTVVNKGGQPFSVPFYHHPREVDNIIVEQNLREKLFRIRDNNGSIFITLDPDAEDNKIVVAGVEIARITGDRFGLLGVPTKSAFIKAPTEATVNTETPIKTCRDANNRTMVIWITLSNKNLVTSEGNCLILEARSYNETVMVADRLVYHLFGVIP